MCEKIPSVHPEAPYVKLQGGCFYKAKGTVKDIESDETPETNAAPRNMENEFLQHQRNSNAKQMSLTGNKFNKYLESQSVCVKNNTSSDLSPKQAFQDKYNNSSSDKPLTALSNLLLTFNQNNLNNYHRKFFKCSSQQESNSASRNTFKPTSTLDRHTQQCDSQQASSPQRYSKENSYKNTSDSCSNGALEDSSIRASSTHTAEISSIENSSTNTIENFSNEATDSSVKTTEISSLGATENSSTEVAENSSPEVVENSSFEVAENSSPEVVENSSFEVAENSSPEGVENSSFEAAENSSVEAAENFSHKATENLFVGGVKNTSFETSENLITRSNSIEVPEKILSAGNSTEALNKEANLESSAEAALKNSFEATRDFSTANKSSSATDVNSFNNSHDNFYNITVDKPSSKTFEDNFLKTPENSLRSAINKFFVVGNSNIETTSGFLNRQTEEPKPSIKNTGEKPPEETVERLTERFTNFIDSNIKFNGTKWNQKLPESALDPTSAEVSQQADRSVPETPDCHSEADSEISSEGYTNIIKNVLSYALKHNLLNNQPADFTQPNFYNKESLFDGGTNAGLTDVSTETSARGHLKDFVFDNDHLRIFTENVESKEFDIKNEIPKLSLPIKNTVVSDCAASANNSPSRTLVSNPPLVEAFFPTPAKLENLSRSNEVPNNKTASNLTSNKEIKYVPIYARPKLLRFKSENETVEHKATDGSPVSLETSPKQSLEDAVTSVAPANEECTLFTNNVNDQTATNENNKEFVEEQFKGTNAVKVNKKRQNAKSSKLKKALGNEDLLSEKKIYLSPQDFESKLSGVYFHVPKKEWRAVIGKGSRRRQNTFSIRKYGFFLAKKQAEYFRTQYDKTGRLYDSRRYIPSKELSDMEEAIRSKEDLEKETEVIKNFLESKLEKNSKHTKIPSIIRESQGKHDTWFSNKATEASKPRVKRKHNVESKLVYESETIPQSEAEVLNVDAASTANQHTEQQLNQQTEATTKQQREFVQQNDLHLEPKNVTESQSFVQMGLEEQSSRLRERKKKQHQETDILTPRSENKRLMKPTLKKLEQIIMNKRFYDSSPSFDSKTPKKQDFDSAFFSPKKKGRYKKKANEEMEQLNDPFVTQCLLSALQPSCIDYKSVESPKNIKENFVEALDEVVKTNKEENIRNSYKVVVEHCLSLLRTALTISNKHLNNMDNSATFYQQQCSFNVISRTDLEILHHLLTSILI